MRHRIQTKRLIPTGEHLLGGAAILSVAVAVAGCGSSSRSGVAHLSSGKGASSASSEDNGSSPEGPASLQQAALAYVKCMRANGVPTFPDPKAGAGFLFHTRTGTNPSSPAFKAAQEECHTFMPGGPPSTTSASPQTLAHFLKLARCMRGHGIPDFPDPRSSVSAHPFGAGGTGVISDIEGVILVFPSTIDQQSPAFTHAAAACAFPLHKH